jgi:glyoxylase-like metal-dependent hydrolase (beta-lactamase superfamily II)
MTQMQNARFRSEPGTDGDFIVHSYRANAAGLFTNAFIVETAHRVTIVDTLMLVSDARALRQRCQAIGKPIEAILITHGHPDHYNGIVELFGAKSVPVFATAGIMETIRSTDAAKAAQWGPIYKDEWPAQRAFPNETVRDGDCLEWDGVRFRVRDLGPGESHSDACWFVGADASAAFLGDIVVGGVHAFLKDGHTQSWLDNLALLSIELNRMQRIYVGHGEPVVSLDALQSQSEYLVLYRETVRRLARGSRTLDERAKDELLQTMKGLVPTHRLQEFVLASADPVANELASE